MTYTSCLFQVVESTMFYDRDFLTFASPLPALKPRFLSLLRPFTLTIWILVGISMFALGVVFFFISNIEVCDVNLGEVFTNVIQYIFVFSGKSYGVQFKRMVNLIGGCVVLLWYIDRRVNYER